MAKAVTVPQTDVGSEPDSAMTQASDLPRLARFFMSEMGLLMLTYLMEFHEERVR